MYLNFQVRYERYGHDSCTKQQRGWIAFWKVIFISKQDKIDLHPKNQGVHIHISYDMLKMKGNVMDEAQVNRRVPH